METNNWQSTREELKRIHREPPKIKNLERLCQLFNLSPFEQDILLLCAGMELHFNWATWCAIAQKNPKAQYPTLGLALALFDRPDFKALSPVAPLRYWQLIAVEPEIALIHSPLKIDEGILHYITGNPYLDLRLSRYLDRISCGSITLV